MANRPGRSALSAEGRRGTCRTRTILANVVRARERRGWDRIERCASHHGCRGLGRSSNHWRIRRKRIKRGSRRSRDTFDIVVGHLFVICFCSFRPVRLASGNRSKSLQQVFLRKFVERSILSIESFTCWNECHVVSCVNQPVAQAIAASPLQKAKARASTAQPKNTMWFVSAMN